MDDEKRENLERERAEINLRAKELSDKLKEAEAECEWDLAEKIDKELDVLSRRQKYVLWKLGKYKFTEDDLVEYEPGKFMKAEQYYWLVD